MHLHKKFFYIVIGIFLINILFYLWGDISFLIKLNQTVHTEKFGDIPAVISERGSKYGIYGIIFLKVCILLVTISFLYKRAKYSFILFNSIVLPFFIGLFFLEIRNKFMSYEFNSSNLKMIVSISLVYLSIFFTHNKKICEINFSVRDFCLIVLGILFSVLIYLIVFYKL